MYWRLPESGGLWHKSRQIKRRFDPPLRVRVRREHRGLFDGLSAVKWLKTFPRWHSPLYSRRPRPQPPPSSGVLRPNVKRFRGGLSFKAHRPLYHSTLGLRVIKKKKRLAPNPQLGQVYWVRFLPDEREIFFANLLVRIHFIIEMIRWTGLAPWEFEFPFPGSLTSTFLCRCTASGSCQTTF